MKKIKISLILVTLMLFSFVTQVNAALIGGVEKVDTDRVLMQNDKFEWQKDTVELDKNSIVLGATLVRNYSLKNASDGIYAVVPVPQTAVKTTSNPNTTILSAIYRNVAKYNGQLLDCKVEMFDVDGDNNSVISGIRYGFQERKIAYILAGEFDSNPNNDPDFPEHIKAKVRISFYKAGTYQVSQGTNESVATIKEGEKVLVKGARIAVGGWNSELTEAETGTNSGIKVRQSEWLSVDAVTGSDVTKAYASNSVLIEYVTQMTGLYQYGDNIKRDVFTNNYKRYATGSPDNATVGLPADFDLIRIGITDPEFIKYGCYFLEVGESGELLFEFGKTTGSIELAMFPISLTELPNDPVKTVTPSNGTGVYREDTLVYEVKQEINKRNVVTEQNGRTVITEFGNCSHDFTYDAMSFYDKLPEEVEYLVDENRGANYGIFDDSGNKVGDFSYDAATHSISYEFSDAYLKNTMKYQGETYNFKFKVKVKSEFKETDRVIKNAGKVTLNNEYELNTNEVQNPILNKGELVVLHVEKGTDTTTPETITDVLYPIENSEGRIDQDYETVDREEEINKASTKYKYKLINTPENAVGKYIDGTIYVIYEYEKIPANVIVKHLELDTNNELAEQENIDGYIGEDYTTYPKDIDGYTYVENKAPENAKGQMEEDTIEVIYYYAKIAPPNTGDIAVYLIILVAIVSIAGIVYVFIRNRRKER